jgi:hypothetical protein
MSIRSGIFCLAIPVALAFPPAVRAQPPGDLPAAGVELGAAALDLHTAAQETVAGTPGGDALIRDLQIFRTAVDEFRNAGGAGRERRRVDPLRGVRIRAPREGSSPW